MNAKPTPDSQNGTFHVKHFTTTLYHGSAKTDWTPHVGATLTLDQDAAEEYAQFRGGATLITLTLDESAITIADLDDDNDLWHDDHASHAAFAAACPGADIIVFEDTPPDGGMEITAYRIMTEAGVAALTVTDRETI